MPAHRIGIVLGLALMFAAVARAEEHECAICGCKSCLLKICVPKKIEKTVTKVCWDVKCEDVCVPGCSEHCGEVCKEDKCGCWYYNIWKPGCATIKTRRVPVKTEVKRKVPAFEWTVEYRCPKCCRPGCKRPADAADQDDDDAAEGDADTAAAPLTRPTQVADLQPIERK